MFVTEEYVINGFDMYDENDCVLGCQWDPMRLVISCGSHIISYELWFDDHREVVTRKLKSMWSTDELDLMLQEVLEKMCRQERWYGYVYYDVNLIAA